MDFSKLSSRPIFFDGATGTMLQRYGLPVGTLGETFNIERPNTVLRLHKSYLRAGADIVKTNTFSANRLKADKLGYPLYDIVSQGALIAKNATEEMHKGYVALDIGPLGVLLSPLGELSFDEAVDIFKETIEAGRKYADLILIETMSDLYEVKAAMIAAKECCDLPIFVTCTFDENGNLLSGADAESFVALAEGLGAAAVGINCGCGPSGAKEIVRRIAAVASVPVIANPNAGLPEIEDGATKYSMVPKDFGYEMAEIVESGAQIIGGCCGTTPDHISSAYASCIYKVPVRVADKKLTVVCSSSKCVKIGCEPKMIGERINPTGKAKLKTALREKNFGYVVSEALLQESAGADILDVNVGLADTDEKELLRKSVFEIQKVCKLPLQLDSTNHGALESAMRIYNGKPVINSVNGSKESILSVMPLVKKYGGVMIALTLDEQGIPETAEGRLKIAKRIVTVAEAFGIGRKNIIFDTLAMTCATDPMSASVTLEAMKLIQTELGVKTVLGVSNISFGLPERDAFTSVFLTQALSSGLSAAIMNPLSKEVKRAYLAYLALNGYDKNCKNYIGFCTDDGKDKKEAESLCDAIIGGLDKKAKEFCEKLIADGTEPTQIINGHIIPALDKVGELFGKGKIFLPELLLSASASECAFGVIKAKLEESGKASESKGKIVLATVKGDIHDLGKNIVKALLCNFGYDVVDLGKDVAPEVIADAVVRENAGLVGLSALMTTTAPNMAESIKVIREVAPKCSIMVGGAVITEEYADRIGADFYAKDAVEAVSIANTVFGK